MTPRIFSTNLPARTDMNPRKTIPALIRRLIEAFISERRHLQIKTEEIGSALKISIRSSKSDMGRIVGREGHHLEVLSTLVMAMGEKAGETIFIEHLEPIFNGEPPENKARWDDTAFDILAEDTARAVFDDAAVEIHRSGMTVMVEVRTGDKQEKADRIGGALKSIFNAIGKANGRKIFVSVLPALATEAKR